MISCHSPSRFTAHEGGNPGGHQRVADEIAELLVRELVSFFGVVAEDTVQAHNTKIRDEHIGTQSKLSGS